MKEISAALSAPEVVSSDVSLDLTDGRRYFVNSEGFRTLVADLGGGVPREPDAAGRRRDADSATRCRSWRGRPALPAQGGAARRPTKSLLDALLVTRAAAVGDDYSGPVLLEHDAAATLLAQSFVPLFLARRPPDSDDSRGGSAVARVDAVPDARSATACCRRRSP